MTRNIRLLLLLVGLGVVVMLVWRTGPRIVVQMISRVGWTFPLVAGAYSVHLAFRAAALWRVMLDGAVPFMDVLRIRFSGEAVEMLTFTGPFLAEPAKGWLLKQRGVATAGAFAAVLTEYLLYTVVSSCLAIAALLLLLFLRAFSPAVRSAAVFVLILTMAFVGAVAFASFSGVGLITPALRLSRMVIGQRAERAADDFSRIEELIIRFLHVHRGRLVEVLAIETAAHGLLALEIWLVFGALGLPRSWVNAAIVEGSVKFIPLVFAFVPGQIGASEGVYAWLAGVIGLPTAAGLSLALVRRLRGLVVAAIGVITSTLPADSIDRTAR